MRSSLAAVASPAKREVMQRDRAERRRRAVGPDRVDRVAVDGDQRRRPALAQAFGKPLGAVDGVQPRVEADAVAGA